MQRFAAWLVARPLHAVLGLSLTLVLPFAQVLSGAVMVMLVLYGGVRIAALQGLIALAVLAALSLVDGGLLSQILITGLIAWLPVFLLAWLLRQSRSLTLALQASVIVVMVLTIGFFVVIDDPTAYWLKVLDDMAGVFREAGADWLVGVIDAQKASIAPYMTMLTVLTNWSLMAFSMVLGYTVYQALPNKSGEFGRFCDLRFGRVLAGVGAVTVVLALLVGAEWLQNLALIGFAIFWLQGLSIMHWLHIVGLMPVLILIVVYAMLPFLNALPVVALAVLGYTDAWFDYRARIGKNLAR